MAHVRFSPWSDFDHLHTQMERMFDTRVDKRVVTERRVNFSPAVDVFETEAAFAIDLDLPGIKRETVHIEVLDGVLHVRGERSRRKRDEEAGYHRTERRFGAFERAFRLPKNVDGEAISARSTDGVLTITLPKKPEPQPRRIQIEA
ncbi:MAG: Hsp20/alpha crystallin family protein [Myxococcales bacterium]|nr:Hsp20/alpha crystallin family protein [Myxococcales bacterium]